MSNSSSPDTYRELVRALISVLNEPEEESPEEVDEYLRTAGYDPDEVVVRMQLRIKNAIDASPLNWRNATDSIHEEKTRLKKLTELIKVADAGHLKSEVYRLLRLHGTHPSLAVHHRNLNLEEMSEADLASLLAELKYQLTQSNDLDENEE